MILVKMSQQRYHVLIERDELVPMQDGTKLATDIYRPDTGETFPAIVYRTPYDKSRDETQVISRTFAQHTVMWRSPRTYVGGLPRKEKKTQRMKQRMATIRSSGRPHYLTVLERWGCGATRTPASPR
jgi:hypothetical protein